jgi:mannose/cellobiose epimerase-like protein (N-acyl-D-glucosamine 2-epimerase family)
VSIGCGASSAAAGHGGGSGGASGELPDFRGEAFLRAHIATTMAFYHPRAIDPRGGFFHYFRDDGTVYDTAHRHLVSSTRFVFNYALAAREFADDAALRGEYVEAARHGLRYLRERHRDPASGGYAWTIRDGKPEDRTQHAYGAAFVLLAYATACRAGIDEARVWLEETWALLERRYFDERFGLYRDEADPAWHFSGYRGQNSNMHLTEALLAAWQATAEQRYLERALTLADHMTRRQASKAGGLVWEHYDCDWNVDWNYNRDNPKHLFRPWGFQPGHQTEWAKLLLTLDEMLRAHGAAPAWQGARARELFDAAVARAWDSEYGGLCYGFAPDGTVCDDDKYFWVQAESIAAAARLACVCRLEKQACGRFSDGASVAGGSEGGHYWQWYQRLWAYAWRHFVDHRYGAWYRILDRTNRKYSDEKSPAGKTDYHTMGACYDVLHLLRGKRP